MGQFQRVPAGGNVPPNLPDLLFPTQEGGAASYCSCLTRPKLEVLVLYLNAITAMGSVFRIECKLRRVTSMSVLHLIYPMEHILVLD